MLRQATKSVLPRLGLGIQSEIPAVCSLGAREFTSSAPTHGIHIEDEVYNRQVADYSLFSLNLSCKHEITLFLTRSSPLLSNRQRQTINLGNRVVTLSPDSWVAPSAVIVGDVDIYEQVSIWHNCVLRGDLNSIKVGAFSNVQDRTVIHAARSSPTGLPAASSIGRSVTIGQGCLLRSVTIEDECIVGDKSILLEGSMMEKNSVLEAGSVVPPGRRIPSGQLWSGNPARYVRDLTKDEKAAIAPLAASVYPLAVEQKEMMLPETMAYRDAEELRAAMKPEAALVQGADLEAAVKAASS